MLYGGRNVGCGFLFTLKMNAKTWILRNFETSCAVGAPLPMRLEMASEYTVEKLL